ncbi:Immunity protein Imm1 [Actinoalloteichus cyanogriseus DSM 43889]|uniref:Immunity protein Imm1 n=1 Tax=Actinoalloteichus caeruleus DSM 43889 TaxID=1120930 RepID=A0ABT1JN58_ACTCY|nr:Immunity protein Imm1 [Actinoalloteichus caeruleus DSM 43889]
MNVVSAVVDNDWQYATTSAERATLARLVVDEPHPDWASLLYVCDHRVADDVRGPDWQLRVSTDPARGIGAMNWIGPVPSDELGPWDTFNPFADPQAQPILFDGSVPSYFPPSAALPIEDVRRAVAEHLCTGLRPECVRWQPGDRF